MIRAAALALCAAPAAAAPLAPWHGPGGAPCGGRCGMEWAISHLPADKQAELAVAMRRDPQPMWVRDGDVLPLMTYYRGEPVADTRGLVAVLDYAEPATGWQMDGWRFLQVHACRNWAAVQGNAAAGASPSSVGSPSRGGVAAASPALFVGGTLASYAPGRVEGTDTRRAVTPSNPPPPISLPAAGWMLVTGIAALLGLKIGRVTPADGCRHLSGASSLLDSPALRRRGLFRGAA